jgi:hypothetical protein
MSKIEVNTCTARKKFICVHPMRFLHEDIRKGHFMSIKIRFCASWVYMRIWVIHF